MSVCVSSVFACFLISFSLLPQDLIVLILSVTSSVLSLLLSRLYLLPVLFPFTLSALL